MNNIKKLQIYAHIDGMRNKEHQNSDKGTWKRETKNHKDLEILHVQPHPQSQVCMWLKNIQPM
jgi:hypothetical protein